jgi:hypothetical protein
MSCPAGLGPAYPHFVMNDDTPTRRVDPDDYATRVGLAAGRRVFGRYTLEAIAGRGGMGVVWRARDEELERDVALKFLPETVAADSEALRDLKRETRRCLELTHPHIVRVHDFVQEPPLAAIAMEYIAGESLAKMKAEAPGGCLTVEQVAPLAAQLCAALDYAHRTAKVVHRDLKPANVLVAESGVVKVTDFGIARSLSDTRTRLTGRAGDTSGTLPYMSPQQLLGEDPSAADDIYALGATLYELLAGKPPFYTGDITLQIRDVAPKPLNERCAALGHATVPKAWEETIMACLAKEPKNRPKTAGEVARRLGIADFGSRGETMVPDDTPTVRIAESPGTLPAPKSKRPLLALIATLVLLGLGVGYYFGLYAPEQERRAEVARQQEQQNRAAVEAEKQRIAQEAERQRKEKEQMEAAAKAKTDQEQSDYTAMVARIAAVRDDSPRADLDAAERVEQSYLAVAPERFKAGVQRAWESRRTAWLAYEASHRPGSLKIETDPADATVILYPRGDRMSSPADFEDIKPGEISFRVEKEGYEPQEQKLSIQPGTQSHPGLIRLLSLTGSAVITSQPSGVKVSLDGNSRHFEGVTPFRQPMIPPGSYQATLQRENWRPVVKPITIKRDEEAKLAVDLRGVNLNIESAPVGALVMLNGKESGVTPLTLTDQPPGQYQVTLTNAGYDPDTRTIMAEKDTTVTVTLARSVPKTSTLVIYREAHTLAELNSPAVKLNEQSVGNLPNGCYFTLEYPAGQVDLNVQPKFGARALKLHVDLLPGKTIYVRLSPNFSLSSFSLQPVDESEAKKAISGLNQLFPTAPPK